MLRNEKLSTREESSHSCSPLFVLISELQRKGAEIPFTASSLQHFAITNPTYNCHCRCQEKRSIADSVMASSLFARTVHLIVTAATLLSGDLDECLTPPSDCKAGVAAVDAWARHLTVSTKERQGQQQDPYVVLPLFDKGSPFVQMHPLGWVVNRLVLQHVMDWRVFRSTPALLTQHKGDFDVSTRDLTDMQSSEFPFLLSNAAIPPANSWSPYVLPVYFDQETGLAIMSVVNSNQPLNYPQVEATIGILDQIERINALQACRGEGTSLLDKYINRTVTERQCWIPVIVYADTKENFLQWLTPVVNHENPPALVVNVEEEIEEYAQVKQVGETGVWVISYEMEDDVYVQLPIDIAQGGRIISNVGFIQRDMGELPEEVQDDIYVQKLQTLRGLASEAATNDPVVGQSVTVPPQRDGSYRRCKAGECEIGNLFNDAARWYADVDVAFQASGGFRGNGWSAGGVRVSDIWGALPFDNGLCTGVISGVSLFKLFNYSITYSTFEGENTQLGDRLLQVSGLRISYNLGLANTTRLVAMEVWDKTTQSYQYVDRLGLYSFVTDSYMCSGFVEYPKLLGSDSLTMNGEEPGEIGDDIIIQTVVADYLLNLNEPYDPAIGNRLVNRTDIMQPLNLIQTADSCLPGEYWQEGIFTCSPCPNRATVAFLDSKIEFEGDGSGKESTPIQSTRLVNAALFDVAVLVKSMPIWVSISSAVFDDTERAVTFSDASPTVKLESGSTLVLSFQVDMTSLEPGTAQGTVAFGVLDGGTFPGCSGVDAAFEIFARKLPSEDLHQLGPIRYVGWALAFLALVLALAATAWVFYYRNLQVVRTLQPTFLVMISLGVFVMALSLIPLGIDDEIASDEWCDTSCMSIPWLISLGFTAAMASLFSKLWRINRLFKAAFRRVNLKIQNVMAPFTILLSLNCTALLVWTLLSPLRWQRLYIDGEPWNSYGTCRSNNETIGTIMTSVVVVINTLSLFFACYFAYMARDIGDEFAESKSVGLALFSWVQLFVVAVPMLFLIDSDNPAAKYFLQSGVVFAVCVSMLCFIFGPVVWQKTFIQSATPARAGQSSNATMAQSSGRNSGQIPKFSLRERGQVRVSGLEQIGGSHGASACKYPSLKDLANEFRDCYSPEDEDENDVLDAGSMPETRRMSNTNLRGSHRTSSAVLEPVEEFSERSQGAPFEDNETQEGAMEAVNEVSPVTNDGDVPERAPVPKGMKTDDLANTPRSEFSPASGSEELPMA